MNAMSDMSEAVMAMDQGSEGERLIWVVVRVNQPRNPNRRTALMGAEYETYRDRAGHLCKRAIKGTGKRVSVPELILQRAGFRTFQPMTKVWRQVNPRKPERVLIPRPMLSGWMFVGWANDRNRFPELMALEVVQGLLGDQGRPAIISERAIKGFMRQWAGRGQHHSYARYMRTGHEFSEGDEVTVTAGPFSGFSAQVQQIRGRQAEILVDIFGRATSVEMDLFDLKGGGLRAVPSPQTSTQT